MTLFPMIQPQAAQPSGAAGLYKEIAWDYKKDKPVYRNGEPVFVTGMEAVTVWAWLALHTPRFKYEIYTWDYGNEMESMIGKPFTDELKQAEAPRYVRECLMTNPYVTDVKNIEVSFTDDDVGITCTIVTVYGEVNIDV